LRYGGGVPDLLTIVFSVAGVAAAALLALAWARRADAAELLGRRPLDTGPDEPGWTETIASDGRHVYGRAQSADAVLIALDARAARDDFPIPKTTGG
jgi:hypothetical protein